MLLVTDGAGKLTGLLTLKDTEKSVLNPHACKDEMGRLRVAAASTVGDAGFERSQALIDAGWSTTGIVVISQLVAFLSFQIRVVAGLRAMQHAA